MPARRGRRTSRQLWVAGALALAAAGLTPLLIGREPDQPTRRAEAGRQVSAQPAPAQSTSVESARPAPLRPTVEITLNPPYEVADGLTIVSETRRVRLAGLEGPASEAACFDPAGRLWACGLQARAALYNLIRTKPITCRAPAPATDDIPSAECRVGSAPLDRDLVLSGFARSAPGRIDLAAELAAAKADNRGLWNGGWRVRP